MNKTQKILLSLGTIATTITPVFGISFASSNKVNKNHEFYFDGRSFKSEEEALAYLIQNNKFNTGNQKVFGDIKRSYLNAESGQLNKNFLPDYDVSKIHFAYYNAGHGITSDYDSAKNSYFNPGTVVNRFIDGFSGDTFASETAAKNSIINHRLNTQLSFYNVDLVDGPIDPKKGFVKRKLNPFNVNDIANLKENISNNIENILLDNIENTPEDIKNAKRYKIKFDEEGVDISTLKLDEDNIAKWIKEFLSSDDAVFNKIRMVYNDKSKKLIFNHEGNKILKNLKSIEYWSGDYKHNSSRFFLMLDKDKDNKIGYTIKEWTSNVDWNKTLIDNLKATELASLINGANLDNKYYNTQTQVTASELDNEDVGIKIIYSKLIKHITKKVHESETDSITKSKLLNSFLIDLYDLDDTNKDLGEVTYKVTKLPYIRTEFWKYGAFGIKINHKQRIKEGKYEFIYNRTFKRDIQKLFKIDKFTPKGKSTFNSLWELATNKNTSKKITISKNGIDLFEGKLKLSDKGAFVFEGNQKLDIAKNNHKGSKIEVKPDEKAKFERGVYDINNKDNITKYLSFLLDSLKEQIEEARKNKKSIKSVFDKFFKQSNGSFKGGIYTQLNTRDDMSQGRVESKINLITVEEKKMEANNFMKKFFSQINDAYKKYSEEYVFENISKNIPYVKDILLVKPDESLKNLSQTLAEYTINAVNDFNPILSKGYYSSDGLLATTTQERDAMKDPEVSPAMILIAYDNNGKVINAGDYVYDSAELLEYNSKLTVTPERDFKHIFIDGYSGPVSNEVHNIYSLKMDDTSLYFDKFSHLKAFMLKYIREHSERIGD